LNNPNLTKVDLGDIVQTMKQWRQAIHQYPETAYEEFKTAKLVSSVLKELGYEVHEKIAVTGVVGILKKGESNRSIGLRADMDALHLSEINQFEHRSQVDGKMHACGHDGHTSMLLGAATYLAREGDFDGTVYIIFQPAEEVEGGAQRMIDEGVLDKFKMDAIFGMHNMPKIEAGSFSICPGPLMAAFASFECEIKGKGMHSSMPHLAIDPIEIGTELTRKWKAINYEVIEPLEPSVISVTEFHSGTAHNIIPETAMLKGSARCFSKEVAETIRSEMEKITREVCQQYGAEYTFSYRQAYPTLINEPVSTRFAADIAADLVGEANLDRSIKPVLGSEDFACFLEHRPGAYIFIGNGIGSEGGCMIHNPGYDFNDKILEVGASYWVHLTQSYLARNVN